MAKSKKKNRLNAYAKFSGIAFQMIAIIGLGTYGGIKLDERYPNDYSLYTLVLSFASVIIALIYVVRRVLQVSKNQSDKQHD